MISIGEVQSRVHRCCVGPGISEVFGFVASLAGRAEWAGFDRGRFQPGGNVDFKTQGSSAFWPVSYFSIWDRLYRDHGKVALDVIG